MKEYAFGVDIGGTNTKIGLIDLRSMSVIHSRIIKTVEGSEKKTLARIISSVREIQLEEGIGDDTVERIGVGILGPVIDGRYVLSVEGFHWDNHYDLKAELIKSFGWDVLIENDVNTIAIGEYNMSREKFDDVIVVAIGTDIGVGIIIGGALYSGKDGTVGEIAHIQLDPTKRMCEECKLNGCTSILCGGANVIESFNLVSSEIKIKSIEELYHHASRGVVLADSHIEEFHENLAKVIRLLYLLLDPELIIIAGGVSLAGERLLKALNLRLNVRGTEFVKSPLLALSQLGSEAGVLGAALLCQSKG